MALRHLLVAALAASVGWAAECECVEPNQTIDAINKPMIFFQQPTIGGQMNGNTCSKNCELSASLPPNSEKFSLQVQLLSNSLLKGTITVKGMNESIFINSDTKLGVFASASYGDNITLVFEEPEDNNGVFMLIVQQVNGRPDAPVEKTTAAPATTVPYDHKFDKNPLLVANDIMLVLDMSSSNLEQYQKFATALIDELYINPKAMEGAEDCDAGSRLSVVGLSALDFSNLYAPQWTSTGKQAIGNINSMVKIGNGAFKIDKLDKDYMDGFRDEKGATSCKNRGKILMLLTSNAPSEFVTNQNNAVKIDFITAGVHPILVNYAMKDNETAYYNLYSGYNTWGNFSLTGGDDDVVKFINSYLVSASTELSCQLGATPAELEVVATDTATISLPAYYDGQNGQANKNWETAKHYCNFQETTVKIKRELDGDTAICMTAYYDLEPEKDFVTIYSGSGDDKKVVVRLTGSDVYGSKFTIPGAVGSVVFSSDEKNVFDGFYATIEKGVCVYDQTG